MNRLLSVLFALLMLAACNSNASSPDRYYLIDSVSVAFNEPTEKHGADNEERNLLREMAEEQFNSLKGNVYFHFTQDRVTVHHYPKPQIASLKHNRFEMNGTRLTLSETSPDKLTLVSDKESECGLVRCTATLRLVAVDKDAPQLRQLQDKVARLQMKLEQQKARFATLVEPEPTGFIVSVNALFKVRMPYEMDSSLDRWDSGIYFRNIGKLRINWQKEGNEIYAFNNSDNSIAGELIVVPGKKEDFSLAAWLDIQQAVLASTDSGAAYYNQQGIPETLFFQYDAASQRYFIGIATAQSLETLAQAYQILRSMTPEHRYQNAISVNELTLPADALEKRTGVTTAALFDSAKTNAGIIDLINNSVLDKASRDEKKNQKRREIQTWFKGSEGHVFAYLFIHKGTLKAVMDEAMKEYPGGKVAENLYIFKPDVHQDASYSYYVVKNGLVFEFFVGVASYTQAERMVFLNVLRELDSSKIVAIPPAEQSRLFSR